MSGAGRVLIDAGGPSLKGEGPSLPRSLDGPNLYVRDEEHLYVNAGQEPRESSCEFAKSIAA